MRRLGLPARVIVPDGSLPWGMQGGRQWFDMRAGSAAVVARAGDLITLVERLRASHPNAARPVVLGFSQGAMLALQAVALRPDLFAGVAALSGYLAETQGTKADHPVPLLLTTGDRDQIIRPAATLSSADALRALGHSPEVLAFHGAHDVPPVVLERVRSFVEGLLGP